MANPFAEFISILEAEIAKTGSRSIWQYRRARNFLEIFPEAAIVFPSEGWKVRANVSIGCVDAPEIFRAVCKVAMDHGFGFKIMEPSLFKEMLGDVGGERYAPEEQGKLITIWVCAEEVKALVRELDKAISAIALAPAPIPLSDERLTKNLSFRWGAYDDSGEVTSADGHKIPDELAFFSTYGRAHPISGEIPPNEVDGTVVLFGKYIVDGVSARTFYKTIYEGRMVDGGGEILIKEGRAYTGADERIENEYRVLEHLQRREALMVPSPLDLFRSSFGDRFLVMNRILATRTLYEWRHEDPIKVEDQIKVVKWIAESVCALHGEGVVWSDLSPSNILIGDDEGGDDGGCVYLIDFEHAILSPSPPEDISSDLRALGRLMLWLANPLDSLFKYPYPYRLEANELAKRYPSCYIDACHMALDGVGLEEILSNLREFA